MTETLLFLLTTAFSPFKDLLLLLLIRYMFVYLCGGMYMLTQCCPQKPKAKDPSRANGRGSCDLTWVLGTELGFSARALSILDLWAIFPAPIIPFSALELWNDLSTTPSVHHTQSTLPFLTRLQLRSALKLLVLPIWPLYFWSHTQTFLSSSARLIFPKHFNWAALLLWKGTHNTYRERNAPLPASSTIWTVISTIIP